LVPEGVLVAEQHALGIPPTVRLLMRDVMKTKGLQIGLVLGSFLLLLSLGACSSARGNPAAEAPPPVKVVPDVDLSLLTVEHPEQFALRLNSCDKRLGLGKYRDLGALL
jgi:hypothetical protein